MVELSGIEEKAWRYLVDHKTPITACQLSQRWLRDKKRVAKALSNLEKTGLADVVKIGHTKYYKFKD